MLIIEAEFFDECNELFLGPFFIIMEAGFFMASGNRTLGAVLRNFFLFFLQYKKNQTKKNLNKSTYLCSSCKPPHADFAEFSSGSVRGRFQFYRPFWW